MKKSEISYANKYTLIDIINKDLPPPNVLELPIIYNAVEIRPSYFGDRPLGLFWNNEMLFNYTEKELIEIVRYCL